MLINSIKISRDKFAVIKYFEKKSLKKFGFLRNDKSISDNFILMNNFTSKIKIMIKRIAKLFKILNK
mgnify:CR=1 FL=1